MIVALDGMGGDFAPDLVIEGAVDAVNELNVDIVITGPEEIINDKLKKYTYPKEKIKIINAKWYITMMVNYEL
jgi:glycerol-3-phosphate acyltransferase PlsX